MKKGIIIAGVLVIILLSAFAYKKLKKEGAETDNKNNSGGGTGGSGGNTATGYPIKYGQRGALVKSLQERLNNSGAYPKLVEDGIFGNLTKAAVAKKFGSDGTSVSASQFESLKGHSANTNAYSADSVEFAASFNSAAKKGYNGVVNSELVELYNRVLGLGMIMLKEYKTDLKLLYNIDLYSVVFKIKPKNIDEEIILNKAKLLVGQAKAMELAGG